MKIKLIIAMSICAVIFIAITINPLFNIFSFSRELDKELVVSYGTIIGGLFGPILSLISFFLIYSTFKEQDKQTFINKIDNEIKYLRDYVFRIRYRDSEDRNNILISEKKGEEFFITAKVQLGKLYKQLDSYKIFDDENIIGAAFEIFYFGVGKNTLETLRFYLLKRTNDENVNRILVNIGEQKTKYNEKTVYYGGHQGKLGHYFRQLYHIVESIDNCSLDIDKKEVVKNARVKMSNYEQAILCYNSFSLLGKNWRENNYINKYEIIKNIPQNFLPFDPKKYFTLKFEYEKFL
jgi:hypothetical protein